MTLFWWLGWSCRDFTESRMTMSLKDAEVHLWRYLWALGTGMTLLNASLFLISPHITPPVIRSRSVQTICFFPRTNLYKLLEGELSQLSFSRVRQSFGKHPLHHAPACNSGHNSKEKAVHSLMHVTISKLAEFASTPYTLCIKSILYKRCSSTSIDSLAVQYTKITLKRFMLNLTNPCCLC